MDIAKLTIHTMVKPLIFVFALMLLTYGCDSQVNSESNQIAPIQTEEVSNVLPQFADAVPAGIYRIVWNAALSSYQDETFPFGSPIDLDQRVSNVFEIRVE